MTYVANSNLKSAIALTLASGNPVNCSPLTRENPDLAREIDNVHNSIKSYMDDLNVKDALFKSLDDLDQKLLVVKKLTASERIIESLGTSATILQSRMIFGNHSTARHCKNCTDQKNLTANAALLALLMKNQICLKRLYAGAHELCEELRLIVETYVFIHTTIPVDLATESEKMQTLNTQLGDWNARCCQMLKTKEKVVSNEPAPPVHSQTVDVSSLAAGTSTSSSSSNNGFEKKARDK